MTIKQIIAQLEEQGLKVEYYTRKDGGVRITQITTPEGKTTKYSRNQSTGNNMARKLVNYKLSKAAKMQRSAARVSKQVKTPSKPKKSPNALPDEAKALLNQVQKEWRKRGLKGKVTTKQSKEILKKYGEAELIRKLQNNLKYAKGIVINERHEYLVRSLESEAVKSNNKALQEALEKIKNNPDMTADQFNEIMAAYYRKHELKSQGYANKSFANKVAAILS